MPRTCGFLAAGSLSLSLSLVTFSSYDCRGGLFLLDDVHTMLEMLTHGIQFASFCASKKIDTFNPSFTFKPDIHGQV